MGCPFAMFASISGINPAHHSSYHAKHGQVGIASCSTKKMDEKERETLTEKMKEATWSVHRQLERSIGVAALMGKSTDGMVTVDRLDYLRFLIMLICIYAQMESIILNSSPKIKQACTPVFRTKSLLLDIQAHLDELMCTSNADIFDLLELQDQHRNLSHPQINVDAKTFLALALQDAQTHLFQNGLLDDDHDVRRITMDYINLLSSRQIDAVSIYVRRLKALSKTNYDDEAISFTPIEECASFAVSQPHPVLAHAYVRYMGDLSGGQHMLKRLSKQFALHHTASTRKHGSNNDIQNGFMFYIFDKPTELKESLRESINKIPADHSSTQKMIEEAKIAFDLHHALFESLFDLEEDIRSDQDLLNEDPADSLLALSIPGAFPVTSFSPFVATSSA